MRGFSKVCLKFAHNLSKTAEDDYTFYEHFKKNRTVQKIHEYHPNILKQLRWSLESFRRIPQSFKHHPNIFPDRPKTTNCIRPTGS